MLDDDEYKETPEEKVVRLHEVARPDMWSVVLQECRPSLIGWRRIVTPVHILLNGSFSDADAQLEKFAANPFCAPCQVFGCHLPDQIDGFL